jgi:23S rRNA pseudouridine1911/1915/1917 synthase
MRTVIIRIRPKEARLDKHLSKTSKTLSRSKVKRLIKEGFVLVNDRKVDPDYEVKKGDKIKVEIPPPPENKILPEEVDLNIVFEDKDILVIEKEAGMVVHPTTGHPSGTLVNALLHHLKKDFLPGKGDSLRPGIIHRLDKGTSGLIVAAKNQKALESLKNQFKDRKVVKKYLTLVKGKLEPRIGEINTPIARHAKNRQKFTVSSQGKQAITNYRVKEYIGDRYTVIEAEPKTGRTHQIRVHFASRGHPIEGDKLYGGRPAPRLFLHAIYLEFTHPRTKRRVSFTNPLPRKLVQILGKIKEE